MPLYLMRHGRTRMNDEQRLQGISDHPLSDIGRIQAKDAGKALADLGIVFDRVISSPLKRALETAGLATGKAPGEIEICRDIIEMSFGDYELHKIKELDRSLYELLFINFSPELFPPSVEPYKSIVKRIDSFVGRMKSEINPKENVLAVSHGAFIHMLIARLRNLPVKETWSFEVKNTATYRIEFKEDLEGGATAVVEEIMPGFSINPVGRNFKRD